MWLIMKLFLVSIISYVCLLSVGSVATSPITLVITQGGSLAILGWGFWYLLSKYLPEERDAFLKAQSVERKDYIDSNKKMSDAINKLTQAIKELIE